MSEPVAYLLDTNVISETRKRKANPGVRAFLDACDTSILFLSVLTLGELYKGVEKKRREDPEAADSIAEWVKGVEQSYRLNIVGINAATAQLWGEWSSGRSRPVVDTLLAATAVQHRLTFVTRNGRDVDGLPVTVLNPWLEE